MTATPAAGLASTRRVGTLAGLGAYGLWGVFPLVFRLLESVGAVEILFHRVVWSFVVVVVLLVWGRSVHGVGAAFPTGTQLRRLALAAALIAVNWLVYIWAVNADHVVEAALGYYVNPLVTVGLGVVVLGERLRPPQVVALGFGSAAVAVLTVASGRVPWIALVLAASFAGYGFLKKAVAMPAVPSLAVETALLLPLALGGLVVLGARGDLSFAGGSVGRDALLVSLGVVTAIPLLLFATAASRIPLTLLGLLQYVTPTMQLLCGVVVLREELPRERLAGFVLVWIALVVLALDAMRGGRRRTDELLPVVEPA